MNSLAKLILTVVLVLFNCQNSSAVSIDFQPAQLLVVPRSKEVRTGNEIVVDVYIVNQSKRIISVSTDFDPAHSFYKLKVWRGNQPLTMLLPEKPSPPADEDEFGPPILGSYKGVTLDPGERTRTTFELSRYFDVSKPGAYRLQFEAEGESVWLYYDGQPQIYQAVPKLTRTNSQAVYVSVTK